MFLESGTPSEEVQNGIESYRYPSGPVDCYFVDSSMASGEGDRLKDILANETSTAAAVKEAWMEDYSKQYVTGTLSCFKSDALVNTARVSGWLKAWNVIIPSFHPCVESPTRSTLAVASPASSPLGFIELECYIKKEDSGISNNYFQLYVEHRCSVDGSKIARYIDVPFAQEGKRQDFKSELYPPANYRD